MWHQVIRFSLTKAFLDSTFNPDQPCTKLIFSQFTDTPYTTVAQMVDIVDLAASIAQFDQNLDDRKNIVIGQSHRSSQFVTTDPAVEFHPADSRQIVPLFIVEKAIEQSFNRFFSRRFTWAHHTIDGNSCRHLIDCFINTKRL